MYITGLNKEKMEDFTKWLDNHDLSFSVYDTIQGGVVVDYMVDISEKVNVYYSARSSKFLISIPFVSVLGYEFKRSDVYQVVLD